MNVKIIKDFCLSKKGSFEDYPFGEDVLVIKVESKMFALISERNNKINISLKCDPFLVENLRRIYPSVTPGYHLNKNHWNTIIVDGTIPEDEILWMIDHSYEMVIKSLSKAKQKILLNEKK